MYLPKHIRPLLETVCPFVCPDNSVRSEWAKTIGNQSRFHESTTDGYTRRAIEDKDPQVFVNELTFC